jgi:Na+/melibiose symporter-like transporter
MATKLALALAVGLAFPLLDAAGFEPRAAQQVPGAGLALAALYAWGPVLLKLAAVALMWRFPLDEKRHAALAAVIQRGASDEQKP